MTYKKKYFGVRSRTQVKIYLRSPGHSWQEKFKSFAEFYAADLPNFTALDGELQLWAKYWETYEGAHPDNISSTLKAVSFQSFENIKVALRILGTLPVTSCECERTFSAMRRLKNYNRSTMIGERLNGLALLHEIVPDFEEVIDKFAAMGESRLKFR